MHDSKSIELAKCANDATRVFMQEMRTIATEAHSLDKGEQQAEIERLCRRVRVLERKLHAERKKSERLVGRLRKYAPEDADMFSEKEVMEDA